MACGALVLASLLALTLENLPTKVSGGMVERGLRAAMSGGRLGPGGLLVSPVADTAGDREVREVLDFVGADRLFGTRLVLLGEGELVARIQIAGRFSNVLPIGHVYQDAAVPSMLRRVRELDLGLRTGDTIYVSTQEIPLLSGIILSRLCDEFSLAVVDNRGTFSAIRLGERELESDFWWCRDPRPLVDELIRSHSLHGKALIFLDNWTGQSVIRSAANSGIDVEFTYGFADEEVYDAAAVRYGLIEGDLIFVNEPGLKVGYHRYMRGLCEEYGFEIVESSRDGVMALRMGRTGTYSAFPCARFGG